MTNHLWIRWLLGELSWQTITLTIVDLIYDSLKWDKKKSVYDWKQIINVLFGQQCWIVTIILTVQEMGKGECQFTHSS